MKKIKIIPIIQLSSQKRLSFIPIFSKLFSKFFSIALMGISLSGCFEKQVACQINGVTINEQLIGKERAFIIEKLGQPVNSDLGVKNFEEYTFMVNNKEFAVILYYNPKSKKYSVSQQKCIKTNPKLEIANHVIWH